MPELNGQKFPYTKKGKKRYQEIKEALKKKKGKKPMSDEAYFDSMAG